MKLAPIDELAPNVAHESNTSMTAILGCATLMLQEPAEPAARAQYLKAIQTEALRMREVVRALPDFSRQRHFTMERMDVPQTVQDSLALIRRRAYLSNVLIEERYEADLPLIEADVARCRRVFLTLITNALLAMPHGGTLTVETSLARHNRQEWVDVKFTDTGWGIPEEHRSRIFDPVSPATLGGQGTGLDLSLAYTIVQQHGGSIGVESEVGRGSTFTVTLPAERPDG